MLCFMGVGLQLVVYYSWHYLTRTRGCRPNTRVHTTPAEHTRIQATHTLSHAHRKHACIIAVHHTTSTDAHRAVTSGRSATIG